MSPTKRRNLAAFPKQRKPSSVSELKQDQTRPRPVVSFPSRNRFQHNRFFQSHKRSIDYRWRAPSPKPGNTVCETTTRAQKQAATIVNKKKPVCEPCRLFRCRACAWLCLTATQKHGRNYCNDKMDTTNMSFPLKRTRNSVLR